MSAALLDYGNRLAGVETMLRDNNTTGAGMPTGICRFSYFTPAAPFTISTIITESGSVAAAATPTLCRMGFYTVASDGALTLVCACASDTALWAATGTEYARALSTGGGLPASYSFVPGVRYAGAAICITAATAPNLAGHTANSAATNNRTPRISGFWGGQTDLPTSVPNASISTSGTRIWVAGV